MCLPDFSGAPTASPRVKLARSSWLRAKESRFGDGSRLTRTWPSDGKTHGRLQARSMGAINYAQSITRSWSRMYKRHSRLRDAVRRNIKKYQQRAHAFGPVIHQLTSYFLPATMMLLLFCRSTLFGSTKVRCQQRHFLTSDLLLTAIVTACLILTAQTW
jgi:hypothetical protein